MFLRSKKGLVPLIMIILLLLVSVILFLYLKGWFSEYKQTVEAKVTQDSDLSRDIEILRVEGSTILVRNLYADNLTLQQVIVGGKTCSIPQTTINRGVVSIDIGACTAALQDYQAYSVSLVTSAGIKKEEEIVKISRPFTVLFQNSACDFSSGYVRVYGMSDIDQAHAQLSTQSGFTYNVCAKHINYTLSVTPGSNNVTLFYLINASNSHVFRTKASVYQVPAQWYPIYLKSSGGTFTSVVAASAPDETYQCFGAFDLDDVYGSHVGDCSSTMPNKLWVKLQ